MGEKVWSVYILECKDGSFYCGVTNDVDARTVVLLSLAKSANILPFIFGKKEIKQRKKRIEQIVNGDIAGKVTKEAIDAMQAAVMVACIMPALMVTTINT